VSDEAYAGIGDRARTLDAGPRSLESGGSAASAGLHANIEQARLAGFPPDRARRLTMMHFKRTPMAIALAGGLAAFAALPARAEQFSQWARVIEATPMYQRIDQPRQECWNETQVEQRSDAPVGAIVGGIAGGVIGHQFGGGRGRDAATVGGAVAGALVGNEVDRDRGGEVVTRDVQRCRTVNDSSQVISGYNVRYEYDGHEFRTRTTSDPGDRIQVRVDVQPDVR
jgi:uncharacterized protein YcfJ